MSRDIYASCGDADLASLSGTTKQVGICEEHRQVKEYFHVATRQTLCNDCLQVKQINQSDCMTARDFCQGIM